MTGKAAVCKSLQQTLDKLFPKKNLGALSYYEQNMLRASTTPHDRLVRTFEIMTTAPTPAAPTVPLGLRQDEEEPCRIPYRERVGGLMSIANATRPDIANAVREVARHAHDPSL